MRVTQLSNDDGLLRNDETSLLCARQLLFYDIKHQCSLGKRRLLRIRWRKSKGNFRIDVAVRFDLTTTANVKTHIENSRSGNENGWDILKLRKSTKSFAYVTSNYVHFRSNFTHAHAPRQCKALKFMFYDWRKVAHMLENRNDAWMVKNFIWNLNREKFLPLICEP